MATPIFTLDTITPRDAVAIDGVNYELRRSTELSVLEHARLRRLSPRYDVLIDREENLSDEEAVELSSVLSDICAVVLKAPSEVLAKLTDVQRLLIVSTFIALSHGMRPLRETANTTGALGRQGMTSPSTGGTASHGSRGSTAVRRRRG